MCNCIEEMNAKLKPHNGRVAQAILMPRDGQNNLRARTLIRTEKLDTSKRKKLPNLLATFCPFCGEREDRNDGA